MLTSLRLSSSIAICELFLFINHTGILKTLSHCNAELLTILNIFDWCICSWCILCISFRINYLSKHFKNLHSDVCTSAVFANNDMDCGKLQMCLLQNLDFKTDIKLLCCMYCMVVTYYSCFFYLFIVLLNTYLFMKLIAVFIGYAWVDYNNPYLMLYCW